MEERWANGSDRWEKTLQLIKVGERVQSELAAFFSSSNNGEVAMQMKGSLS